MLIKHKMSIYLGEVTSDVKGNILLATGFSAGTLPFRYLEVPLSTSRLTFALCRPLLDKWRNCINHWTTKYLSYAGKVELINSVVMGIQAYWCATFILPKGVIRKIDRLCRDLF